ncbi:MAG: anti-sigma factor family protein [Caldilineaceae bacterium]|jgi:hypothetical protein
MNEAKRTLADFELWEIEAYLDGEPMPHLAAFLTENPATLNHLQQEARRTARLQQSLYRFDCPPPETLQGYSLGDLTGARRRGFEEHLQQCPQCSAELAQLRTFVGEAAVALTPTSLLATVQQNLHAQIENALTGLRILIATLVTPDGPALAGVALRRERADDAPLLFLYEAETLDINIMAHRQSDGQYHLQGQLFTVTPLRDATITLAAATATTPVIRTTLTDTTSFTVTDLPPDGYQLVVTLPDSAVVIPNLLLA